MKKLLYILTFFILFECSNPKENITPEINLNGEWQFFHEQTNNWYSATVPGVIHTDLLANNLIEEPYWKTNEDSLQWIENVDWKYQKTFTITEDQLQDDNIEIEFEGLDTYAEVKLNGKHIISANNMFRTWKVEIKPLLKVGENVLEVQFISPINYNKEKYNNYPYKLPSGCETGETRVSSFTRKAAYHFGWDWGPRFVTSGIWKPIKVNAWNDAKITDVYVQTKSISETEAILSTEITIESSNPEEKDIFIIINGEKHQKTIKNGSNTIKHELKIENPKLWWCNGMGNAHLYDLQVAIFDGDVKIDHKDSRYGIRTIELVNEKDSIGTSFFFKLNGKRVFMKGANYIPQDMFLPNVTDSQYHKLLTDVAAANMNMLRVWGGGIYENNIFYDICDEKGILVWQDFMFAGSMYPVDDEFKKNVKHEVKENITRLRNHPSIALWCGNNEIEVAWENWGWQKQYNYSAEDSSQIWNGYAEVFHSLIPNLVNELDLNRDYTPSSPSSNWGAPENFNHGSMHYWGVWHGREPFENFDKNVGRFMVEYGFQSFPGMETIKTFAVDSSQYLESPTMLNRQKSYIGNGLILEHIKQYYDEPKSFEAFVNLSQETQAKGMQMAIQAHINNQPHCMGSLFWQLNDCWPGPSWSIIDYYGKKKKAYEVIKTEFSK
ncbi:MAG: glycoside hydrolase family 2 protein [Vicingaceae bacterium]|nr:glycoside hydrolase family 2 protein [Vicingaceae bacterium]